MRHLLDHDVFAAHFEASEKYCCRANKLEVELERLASEASVHTSTIERLKKRLSARNGEIRKHTAAFDKLSAQHSKLKQLWDDDKKTLALRVSDLQAANAETERLRLQHDKDKESVSLRDQRLEVLTAENHTLRRQAGGARGALEQRTKENKEAALKAEEMRKQLSEAIDARRAAETRLQAATAEEQAIRKEYQQFKVQFARAAFDDAERRVAQARADVGSVDAALQEAEVESAQLAKMAAEALVLNAELFAKNSALRKEVAALRQRQVPSAAPSQ